MSSDPSLCTVVVRLGYAMYCVVLWAVVGLGWARMRLRRIHRPHRPRSERNSAVPKLTAQGHSLRRAILDAVPTRLALACHDVWYEVLTRMCGRLAMYCSLFCFPVPRLEHPGDGGDGRMGVSDAGELHDSNPPPCSRLLCMTQSRQPTEGEE